MSLRESQTSFGLINTKPPHFMLIRASVSCGKKVWKNGSNALIIKTLSSGPVSFEPRNSPPLIKLTVSLSATLLFPAM